MMSYFANLGQDIVSPLTAIWGAFISVLPGLLGGLLIIIFGYLLGEVIEILVIKGLKKIKFDTFIHSLKISKNLERIDLCHLVGVLLKWYVFVIFLAPAVALAKLGMLSVLLLDFARWVPSLLLAILIVFFGWVAADVLCNRIESTKIHSKHFLSVLVKTIIIAFIFVIALGQVGVKLRLLEQTFLILLSAFAFGIALAIGLGFGLALKDDAKGMIRNMRRKL